MPPGPPSRLEQAVSSAAYAARLYEMKSDATNAGLLGSAVNELKAAAAEALKKNGHY